METPRFWTIISGFSTPSPFYHSVTTSIHQQRYAALDFLEPQLSAQATSSHASSIIIHVDMFPQSRSM
jgi:hypothetical protein